VTDKDIIPAFQMFDTEKRGLLEADEILKSLTNVGEKLDEIEANTFKENMNINELGLFDYNGKKKEGEKFSKYLFDLNF
jgi:Ca2+-binding EF-hand superfamily protein